MNHGLRIVRGPDGTELEDDRSQKRVETDRLRLAGLIEQLAKLLPPPSVSTTEGEKTAREIATDGFNHIHEIFTAFSNSDGRQHEMDESSELGPEEKKFLILAASRSNELFLALTQGDWGRVMSLLIEAGRIVKLSNEQERLRSSVVMKLGMLRNGIEDDIVATATGIHFDTEAEALAA